jgi:hypothetical protein
MKLTVVIFALFVLATGGALALMNNACKTSQHSWCAPKLSAAPHAKHAPG